MTVTTDTDIEEERVKTDKCSGESFFSSNNFVDQETGWIRFIAQLPSAVKSVIQEASTDKKVLVVEDNNLIRDMLVRYLHHQGFIVVSALNGLEGKRCFDNERFDLVLTDICMGGMSGNILCKHIKKSVNPVPVIALTGSPWLVEEQFDNVLSKPFSLADLFKSIEDCLSRHNTGIRCLFS